MNATILICGEIILCGSYKTVLSYIPAVVSSVHELENSSREVIKSYTHARV